MVRFSDQRVASDVPNTAADGSFSRRPAARSAGSPPRSIKNLENPDLRRHLRRIVALIVETCLECLKRPMHLPEAVEGILDEPCEFVDLIAGRF
jgi:hypothetical protein